MYCSIQCHKDLEEFVLLAEVDRLFPAVVAFVQVCADASELNQFVLLQTLCERDVIKVVEGVDGRAQTLIVFFFNEEVVQRLVDRLVVVVLHSKHHHHHHHHCFLQH